MKTLKFCLVILLAVSIAPGQTPKKYVKKRDYRWESTVGISPDSFQPTISYRLANISVLGNDKLPLHLSIGLLLHSNEYYKPNAVWPERETYNMRYALLEVRPALTQDPTGITTMRAMLGVGVGSYQLQRPYGEYYPDGFDEEGFPITVATTGGTRSGMGYILSAGLQLQVWRLQGEVRINIRNGWDRPEMFIILHPGLRAKTPLGAAAAHLIWLGPMMVFVFMMTDFLPPVWQ